MYRALYPPPPKKAEYTKKLNKTIARKEIETVSQMLLLQKCPGTEGFTSKVYQTLKNKPSLLFDSFKAVRKGYF